MMMDLRSMRAVVTAVIVAAALWFPSAASAQECDSRALDALAQARRARSFQLDFSRYRGSHRERMSRLYEWLEEDDAEVTWSTQFTMAVNSYKFSNYTLCTSQGEESAQLDGGTTAISLETRNREWNSVLRFMLFDAGDNVVPDQVVRDENGDVVFGDDAVGYGSLFWGAYLQVTEWAGLTIGKVSDTERLQHIETRRTDDGDIQTTTSIETNVTGNGRWYLGGALPKYDLSTDFIFNASDGLDLGLVQAAAIPIPGVKQVRALAGGGYLGYEETAVVQLGASYTPWKVLETRLEIGLEPWRLRSLVGRVDVDWAAHTQFDFGALMPGDDKNTVGIEVGGFAEGSLFNSAHLQKQMGVSYVPGVIGGGKVGLITRPIAFLVEIYGGVNPAHHLSRLVETYDKPLFGNRIIVRAGW